MIKWLPPWVWPNRTSAGTPRAGPAQGAVRPYRSETRPDGEPMWLAVYDVKTGSLLSWGTEVADPLPAGCAVKEIPAPPHLEMFLRAGPWWRFWRRHNLWRRVDRWDPRRLAYVEREEQLTR